MKPDVYPQHACAESIGCAGRLVSPSAAHEHSLIVLVTVTRVSGQRMAPGVARRDSGRTAATIAGQRESLRWELG